MVSIDLPVGDDPYAEAARISEHWREQGVVVAGRPARPVAARAGLHRTRRPDGARAAASSRACASRTTARAGSGRTSARTPAPRRTGSGSRAPRKANLSPIFSLFSDPDGRAWSALESHGQPSPGPRPPTTTGPSTGCGAYRAPAAIDAVKQALERAELLIADGHHRYETARVYAEEIGGEGPHRYVLMCLVALEDPGLTVFPTHRLLSGLRPDQHETLANALQARLRDRAARRAPTQLAPAYGDQVRFGYIDAHFRQPFMLTLKDPAIADEALPDHAEPYRRLDTAVLEALILKGALEMTDEDIDHLNGLGYARDFDDALHLVENGEYDAAFFMAPTPVKQVQAVAETGESMPPKSTYFFPKVPTGLVFNPLTG